MLWLEVLLPVCVLSYLVLVRMCIAKCFKNSRERFICEIIFENDHKLRLWIRHVHTCKDFAQMSQVSLGDYQKLVDLLLISFLYSSTLLLFGCVLIVTPCVFPRLQDKRTAISPKEAAHCKFVCWYCLVVGRARRGKCMVKLIYDFKQGRDTVSNTEHAATSTSIYHSADTTTTVHSLHWVFFQPVQSITAKTDSVRIYW
jgi:hypothetical protein